MGQAVRLPALALMLLAAAVPATAAGLEEGAITLTGVRLISSDRQVVTQEVKAGKAVFEPDTGIVTVDEVSVVKGTDDQRLTATAPHGEVIAARPDKREPFTETPPAPTLEKLLTYETGFHAEAGEGDLLMKGTPDNPATARIEQLGVLHSETIIRSIQQLAIIIPTPFRQEGRMEDGTEFVVQGAALWADDQFREWVYYADARGPSRAIFIVPEADAQTDPTKGIAEP